MANPDSGNEIGNATQASGDEDEFHSPETFINEQGVQESAPPVNPEHPVPVRARSRRMLRSNSTIQNRPEDVGRILERSRSRQRRIANEQNQESSDDDDEQQDSDEMKQIVDAEPAPSRSSSSSVHPERQARVAAANRAASADIIGPRRPPLANNSPSPAQAAVPQSVAAAPRVPVQIPTQQQGPARDPRNANVNNRPPVNVNWPRIPSNPNRAPDFDAFLAQQTAQISSAVNNQRRRPHTTTDKGASPSLSMFNALQQQLQQLTTQVNMMTNAVETSSTVKLPGLDEHETKTLMNKEDSSDFFATVPSRSDISFLANDVAQKKISKDYKVTLKSEDDAIEWFDDYDYWCDEWGIPYTIRFKQAVTSLFPSKLRDQLRTARQNESINNYAELKRWIFRQRNGRLKVRKADRAIHSWTSKDRDTTFQQYTKFEHLCATYKREIRFALDWGMEEHDINRIDENRLFDIFMDNASAKEKLWELFTEKIGGGRRTLLRAKLLAKTMTYLEQGRATKDQTHRKKTSRKKPQVYALDTAETSETGYSYSAQTHRGGYNRNTRARGGGRGRGRYHRSWRRNNKRGNHDPGKNCHLFGHTPDTCWGLHPELKPKAKKRGRVFAMQRQFNKAKQDLETALRRYESSTESEHNTTEQEEEEQMEQQVIDTDNDHQESTESSSPIQFKYRPRH